jgi:RNA polymerase subunit RPABC4/transcription elongation factor Spt4
MKICPKCGRENPDDAVFCKYCGVKLEPTEKDFEWVLLLTAQNQFEADVVANLLEANGVNVMMKRPKAGIAGSFMGSNPLLGSTGPWNVFVMRTDLEKAKEILKAEEADDGTLENDNE